MRYFIATIIVVLAFAAPARAQPNAVEAILIKQFMVCDGAMAEGCARFGVAAFADALVIFKRAADQGHAGAQNNLAMLYETGAGVALDRATARLWFKRSAEAGIAMARYNLSMLLATAHILQQSDRPEFKDEDMAAAFMWLTLAAAAGLELAVSSKPELAEFLTPAQAEAAERMLRAR